MKQTTQYQLNQWEQSDRIMMEDFNADNQKVEQALAGQAEALTAVSAAVAKCGNCKIVYTTYKGTGTYGSNNKSTLTFEGKPLFVAISSSTPGYEMQMVKGASGAQIPDGYEEWLSWSGNSVSWYCTQSAKCQLNTSNSTYYVVALIAMDE